MKMKNQPPESRSFRNKWSRQIERWGYTTMPNLLLDHQVALGIGSSELSMICHLLYYRWDNSKPYPSAETLAKRSGLSVSSVRNNIRKLERKGLVRRVKRTGRTN